MFLKGIGWVCLGAVLWGIAPQARADGEKPRIAVISTGETADFAALITAQFSQIPNLALVERDELSKIGDERALAEMAVADPQNLGRLLRADGLLFIRREDQGVAVRLTAVRLGLVLFDVACAPQADPAQLAELLGSQVEPFVPKLALPPDKAIPLSLLNLHADLGSASGLRIEQALTLLLERRLVATPELVVLERRHAGSLAWEQSLAADLPQPQTGAWWIDGSLDIPSGADAMTVRLRLRSPKGGEALETTVAGSTEKLPELAEALATAISQSVHAGAPVPDDPAASAKEGREFLQEAIWAWHHDKPDQALAAAESAGLLGETASDLPALRISIAVQELKKAGEAGGTADDIDLLKQAMIDWQSYSDTKGESQLQFLDSRMKGEGRTGALKESLKGAGTQMLGVLMKQKNPRQDEVRQALRTFVGFAPLEGKIPNDWTIANKAEDWSESSEEEEAYYRILCNPKLEPHAYWSRGVFVVQAIRPETFCGRFLATPAERSAAYFKMLDDLAADPVTRPVGLFLRAMEKVPSAGNDDYQAMLASIWEDRQAWQDSGELWTWIKLAFSDKGKFPPPADPKLIALLHFYLQHETKWGDGPQKVWHPEFFPKEEAPSLWADLESCKARCLPNGGGGLANYFTELESAYVAIFGNPDAAPLAPVLRINRFWHPDSGESVAVLHSITDAPDGLWVFRIMGEKAILEHIQIGDMTTDRASSFPLSNSASFGFLATPTDVYVVDLHRKPDGSMMTSLDRYNLAAGSWEKRDVEGITNLYEIGDKLYFSFTSGLNEAALGRYDWATDQKIVLASNHRVPAQNPFESHATFRVQGLFPGPGGKPCALIDSIPYFIQEEPGPWRKVFNLKAWYGDDSVKTFGGRTLLTGSLYSDNSTAVLIDAAKDEPEEWIGVPQAVSPDAKDSSGPALPPDQAPAWSQHPLWPGDYRGGYNFVAHGDTLLAFVNKRENGTRYSLLAFTKGKEAPVAIPLHFEVDDAARALLPALCQAWSGEVSDPDTGKLGMTMIPTVQGLCFKPIAGGFWFLSYADLDAYLKVSPPQ